LIFLLYTRILPKLLVMKNTADLTGGKPNLIASISDAVHPLVAFYGIHGRKGGAILLFLSRTSHKTRGNMHIFTK
jgi:hypothetical protein